MRGTSSVCNSNTCSVSTSSIMFTCRGYLFFRKIHEINSDYLFLNHLMSVMLTCVFFVVVTECFNSLKELQPQRVKVFCEETETEGSQFLLVRWLSGGKVLSRVETTVQLHLFNATTTPPQLNKTLEGMWCSTHLGKPTATATPIITGEWKCVEVELQFPVALFLLLFMSVG